MSEETTNFSGWDYFFSALTAYAITAGGTLGVASWAAGKMNKEAIIGASVLGIVAASKDFRALRRLPPVKNGNTDPPFTKP